MGDRTWVEFRLLKSDQERFQSWLEDEGFYPSEDLNDDGTIDVSGVDRGGWDTFHDLAKMGATFYGVHGGCLGAYDANRFYGKNGEYDSWQCGAFGDGLIVLPAEDGTISEKDQADLRAFHVEYLAVLNTVAESWKAEEQTNES